MGTVLQLRSFVVGLLLTAVRSKTWHIFPNRRKHRRQQQVNDCNTEIENSIRQSVKTIELQMYKEGQSFGKLESFCHKCNCVKSLMSPMYVVA